MKVTKAKCGASVPAANGGYMKVKKSGYNEGGMAMKKSKKADEKKSDMDDRSKFAKRAEGMKAYKGGMASKKKDKKKY